MRKRRVSIKDKELRAFLKKGGRKGAKIDFHELLKRAVSTNVSQVSKVPKVPEGKINSI